VKRFIPWSEFIRERDDRIAANQRAAVAALREITTCSCGAPLRGGNRYQCQGCRDQGLGIATALLERDREQRQRDGTGWRPGMRICYATECYPPEEV
jgi:hypothetical protein